MADLRKLAPQSERATHLVVVVHYGPDAPTWKVAGQNHFFEIYQSACEILGANRVTLFETHANDPDFEWHARLLRTIATTQATHVIGQIEQDPNKGNQWSWDVVVSALAQSWDGVFLGVMWDSAFPWLRTRARRLGKLMPTLMIVELCEPITGMARAGRVEVGPCTMPMSEASVQAILERTQDVSKSHDVTFIGALYDYRVELIDQLRALGIDVAVNPHRPDQTRDYAESRANQPSYLDYMAGIAGSELTINFSLASGGPHEQYKIRVQEAALVGTICLTDDQDRTRHFFDHGQYAYFEDIHDLPTVIARVLADRDQLRINQIAAQRRALELATTDFWGRIEIGLEQRGLRSLMPVHAPAEPNGTTPRF